MDSSNAFAAPVASLPQRTHTFFSQYTTETEKLGTGHAEHSLGKSPSARADAASKLGLRMAACL